MINRFRNLLLNLTVEDQSTLKFPEEIGEYSVATYPPFMARLRKAFFLDLSDKDENNFFVFRLLQLIDSTELSTYLSGVRNVRTYNESTTKFFGESTTWSISTIDMNLRSFSTDTDRLFLDLAKSIDAVTSEFLKSVYMKHFSSIYRVSALVTAWLILADNIQKNG